MKFLGIRNGHDCNVTYTDGKKIKYIKLERNLQIKHYHWIYNDTDLNNKTYATPEQREDMPRILDYIRNEHDIKFDELDAICIDPSPDRHTITDNLEIHEPWKILNKEKNPFWSDFKCPIYLLSHHWAHVHSNWPLIDIGSVRNHFVIDGEGEFNRNTTVIKDGRIVDYVDMSIHPGISKVLEMIGLDYGMKGMKLDIAGKTMALQSMHNVSDHKLNILLKYTEHMSYLHFKKFLDVSESFLHQFFPDDKSQRLINLMYLLHVFGEKKIPAYFDLYVDDRSVPITYSGGTGQNTCVNTEVRKLFPNVVIPPHCPDDGISLGCVEFLRRSFKQDPFDNSGFPYWQSDKPPNSRPSRDTIKKTAEHLAQGKIVAWYQGHGELGPRALGNRSILMDPSIKDGKDTINAKVKRREPYRPFGASVLEEHVGKYFSLDWSSPYMLYVVDFKTKDFPAVSHVDNTCRYQSVGVSEQEADYRDLISEFNRLTGIPMVLNTSLNVDGRPIAGRPEDARELFDKSDLDVLVVGDDILIK